MKANKNIFLIMWVNPRVFNLPQGASANFEIPPDEAGAEIQRKEFNGILNQISDGVVFQQTGLKNTYDARRTTGYPKGAELRYYPDPTKPIIFRIE